MCKEILKAVRLQNYVENNNQSITLHPHLDRCVHPRNTIAQATFDLDGSAHCAVRISMSAVHVQAAGVACSSCRWERWTLPLKTTVPGLSLGTTVRRPPVLESLLVLCTVEATVIRNLRQGLLVATVALTI